MGLSKTVLPASVLPASVSPMSLIGSLRKGSSDNSKALEPDIKISMAEPEDDEWLRYAVIGIFVILATAAFYFSRPITLPLIAGLIVGLVLGPLADRMVKAGVPQPVSAGLIVLFCILGLSLVVSILATPFAIWSDRIPDIIAVLKDRVSNVIVMLKRVEGMAADLSPVTAPKVVVAEGNHMLDIAVISSAAAGSMLIFAATVYFYLATRRDLKARMLRLCLGRNARQSAGNFFEQVEAKVATYFGVVTFVNLAVGILTTAIAWVAGLPIPFFWGVSAMVLNYIPFVGPLIMGALLLGAGILDKTNAWMAVWPALSYYVLHLIESNVLTPIAVGRRLTLSPFLLFVSFVFWLWLWGPAGAILSTPIMLVATVAFETLAAYRESEVAADLETS